MYRLLWNNAPVCVQLQALISIFRSVSTQLFRRRMIPAKKYSLNFLLLFIALWLLFILGFILQLGFPCSTTSNIFTVQESRGFLKWKFGKWKPFLMFPCREKVKSVSRQDIQQVSVWGLVVWEFSLGFIINETTKQWSYINI